MFRSVLWVSPSWSWLLLAHIIIPSCLWLDSWYLDVDLCICFHQLLDKGSIMMVRRITNLITSKSFSGAVDHSMIILISFVLHIASMYEWIHTKFVFLSLDNLTQNYFLWCHWFLCLMAFVFYFFLHLSSTPLCKCTTFSLSIFSWEVSKFFFRFYLWKICCYMKNFKIWI